MRRTRIVYCMSRVVSDDSGVMWDYHLREYTNKIIGYSRGMCTHRVPWFLSVHAHLKIEETVEDLGILILTRFGFKPLFLPYDLIHGLICGIPMNHIISFWQSSS